MASDWNETMARADGKRERDCFSNAATIKELLPHV
jgi:hypothetical protein